MQFGICITYDYGGDEQVWLDAVGAFVAAVNADADMAGSFTYEVQRAMEGAGRVHVGRWDRPETVKLLQSKGYFQDVSGKLQAMAGDTLVKTRVQRVWQTA